MSDFSELCPLFNTGVYNELTVPGITFNACSTTNNALGGILTRAACPCSFKFSRSVIVTKVFCVKESAPATTAIVLAMRMATTGTAAMTCFASLSVTTTSAASAGILYKPRPMTQASNQTFLAADALGFSLKTNKADAGEYSFILRYKEK